MRKRSIGAMAVMALSIGLAGFIGTGCGLSTPGGIVDPTEPPDSSNGQGKDLVVPREGSLPGVVTQQEGNAAS